MKVLITGGQGQLAQAFKKYLTSLHWEVWAYGKQKLNISSWQEINSAISEIKPDIVINCAAYNLVDQAESDFLSAFLINTLGPSFLALASLKQKFFLIHFSTDYVFDGEKGAPYHEDDQPNPINKYGLSKFLGEIAIQNICHRFLIFRVSWLYGEGKQNFLNKIISWASSNKVLKIAYDEFSVPTYTETVAKIATKAFQRGLTGLYHLVNNGYASRLEWAKTFFDFCEIPKEVIPVSKFSFNLPAKRPFFSVLSPQKLENILEIKIPHWQEDLKLFAKQFRKCLPKID